MAGNLYIGEISENREIQESFFLMNVRVASSFETPLPGQFIMLRIVGLTELFLSRPFSIYSFVREKTSCRLALLYRVVGKGTQILSGLMQGSQVEINGPLGNGFDSRRLAKQIVLISGGMGIVPLAYLAEVLCSQKGVSATRLTVYAGFQGRAFLVGMDRMRSLCRNIHLCTDDGSCGERGPVTERVRKDLDLWNPRETSLFACGPKAMVMSLSNILKRKALHCQVSLEERMACGVGACLGCAVALKSKRDMLVYKRVCVDGPVFNLSDVVWEL